MKMCNFLLSELVFLDLQYFRETITRHLSLSKSQNFQDFSAYLALNWPGHFHSRGCLPSIGRLTAHRGYIRQLYTAPDAHRLFRLVTGLASRFFEKRSILLQSFLWRGLIFRYGTSPAIYSGTINGEIENTISYSVFINKTTLFQSKLG